MAGPNQRVTVAMLPVLAPSAVPTKVVVANCGTAFLFLSKVDGDSTRAVFGFEHLKHRAVFYEAWATFFNEDNGYNTIDHAKGPMRLRRSFQREVTKHTGFGTVTVHVHIIVQHWRGGTCQSVPELNDRIVVL